MNERYVQNAWLLQRLTDRPATYLREIEPIITRADRNGFWIDTDHPRYIELRQKYGRTDQRNAGCRFCGREDCELHERYWRGGCMTRKSITAAFQRGTQVCRLHMAEFRAWRSDHTGGWQDYLAYRGLLKADRSASASPRNLSYPT